MSNTLIFVEKANKKHKNLYDYSKVVYKSQSEKVCIVCPTHGEFLQTPKAHLSGHGCRKCSFEKMHHDRKWSTERFIFEAKKVHGDKYTYGNVIYANNKAKVVITCPIHGNFEQLPYMHLRGHECTKCGHTKSSVKQLKSHLDFEKEASIVHNNKYTYTSTYTGALNVIDIVCPIHGKFSQRASDHLAGSGCTKCSVVNTGWSYTSWETAGKASKWFTGYKLYVIECWSTTERFIKIGKTFTTISKRFNSLPYEWRIIEQEEGSARYISEKEALLLQQYKDYSYVPKVLFGGSNECFDASIITTSILK